jgi:tRNA pseudouridine38-40 synthase
MRTLKLTLAYDGTNYVGWQRQLNGPSIQQAIEEALLPLTGGDRPPAVAGAGRTDAGVHALAQVASVNVEFALATDAVQRALNVRLPYDIRVMSVEEAPLGFHARFQAKGKTYRYRIVTSAVMPPFDRLYAWHAPEPRNVDAMQRAAALFVGRHDFTSFQAGPTLVSDAVRTIDAMACTAVPGGLVIDVSGDGFLRHMVRAMVGTLLDVGTGLRAPESIPDVMACRDRRAAGPTVPACGLTLVGVRYEGHR